MSVVILNDERVCLNDPSTEINKMAAYFIQTSRKFESLLRGDKETTWIGELKTLAFWRAVGAEFLGTMLFVFVGCSAVVSKGGVIEIAFAFGLAIMAMVMFTGHISGGHINPAVSIAFAVTLAISPIRAAFYVVAQVLGAMTGSGLLYAVTEKKSRGCLGCNALNYDYVRLEQGFAYELLITFILVSVIMATTDGKRTTFAGVGIEIGLTVTLCHIAGIQYTGASMNPARSFGPAVVMNIWKDHWVYWVGPIVGGFLAGLVYKYLLSPYQGVKTVEEALQLAESTVVSEKKGNYHELEERHP